MSYNPAVNIIDITGSNLQTFFDFILNFMREQKVGSREENSGESRDGSFSLCKYRGPNGTKCAIGCIIPDSLYKEKWDEQEATARIVLDELFSERVGKAPSKICVRFLSDLQSAHDFCMPHRIGDDMQPFEYKMRSISEIYKLNFTPPSS